MLDCKLCDYYHACAGKSNADIAISKCEFTGIYFYEDVEKLDIEYPCINKSFREYLTELETLEKEKSHKETVEYFPEPLQALRNTKETVQKELNELNEKRELLQEITPQEKASFNRYLLWKTKELMNKMKTSIEQVQEIWENAMDAPEMYISDFKPEDWMLLSESLQLQSQIIGCAEILCK